MRLGSAAPIPVPYPRVMSALPDLAVAAAYAIAWVSPQVVDGGMLRVLHMTMIVEFLVVHASGFLGAAAMPDGPLRGRQAVGRFGGAGIMLVLIGFYTLFTLAFSFGMKSWFPLVSFWTLMANRMLPLWFMPPERVDRSSVMGLWAAGVVCYLGATFATVVPPIPRLGMGPAAVAGLQLTGGGLWIDEPWRVMAMGLLYFTLMGLIQLVMFGRSDQSSSTMRRSRVAPSDSSAAK